MSTFELTPKSPYSVLYGVENDADKASLMTSDASSDSISMSFNKKNAAVQRKPQSDFYLYQKAQYDMLPYVLAYILVSVFSVKHYYLRSSTGHRWGDVVHTTFFVVSVVLAAVLLLRTLRSARSQSKLAQRGASTIYPMEILTFKRNPNTQSNA